MNIGQAVEAIKAGRLEREGNVSVVAGQSGFGKVKVVNVEVHKGGNEEARGVGGE